MVVPSLENKKASIPESQIHHSIIFNVVDQRGARIQYFTLNILPEY